jgi:molecular chaperone HscB
MSRASAVAANRSRSDLAADVTRSSPKTHFELFGLQPAFDLPQPDLDDRFRRYQAAVHPDRYAGGSDAERRLALHLAANGNEAYRVLSDPTSRAAYLCEINDAPIDAERNTAMPADFLVQQLEWRESIDEVREQGAEAAEALASRLAAERNETLVRVRDLIDVQRDYPGAAMLVRQLMFYDKLQSELRQVLRRRA